VSALPNVCVIGAGASGITTCRALKARGIPYTCFDRGDRVGGQWVLDNSSGLSSAYRELHINVSRKRMEYTDFPMPKSIPDFPHHTHIARYFDDYVDHFRLRDGIVFGRTVEFASRLPGGGWEVELDGGERKHFDALAVASGHHSYPRGPAPPFPGRFAGTEMHSHSYRDNAFLEGRDVVVLGMGNSAMDIAVESSYVARNTYLAARRGAHILPKYVMGRPYDQFPGMSWFLGRGVGRGGVSFQVPWRLRQRLVEAMHRMMVGRMEDYGLPRPDHRFGEAHPSVSGRILDRIAHGRVVPKPNIARFDGDRVQFADGSSVHADVVVYCTGYEIRFPFLPAEVISVEDNRVRLYRRVFRPGLPDVFFVGLIQPLGSVMQIAEAQARWISTYLAGEYALPPEREMRRLVESDERRLAARYVRSARHTIQVDQDEYIWQLREEMRRGRRRAAQSGFRLPVPARTAAPEREPALSRPAA
jgi:dimethylaniline monooxygenase (N-oxide forming)